MARTQPLAPVSAIPITWSAAADARREGDRARHQHLGSMTRPSTAAKKRNLRLVDHDPHPRHLRRPLRGGRTTGRHRDGEEKRVLGDKEEDFGLSSQVFSFPLCFSGARRRISKPLVRLDDFRRWGRSNAEGGAPRGRSPRGAGPGASKGRRARGAGSRGSPRGPVGAGARTSPLPLGPSSRGPSRRCARARRLPRIGAEGLLGAGLRRDGVASPPPRARPADLSARPGTGCPRSIARRTWPASSIRPSPKSAPARSMMAGAWSPGWGPRPRTRPPLAVPLAQALVLLEPVPEELRVLVRRIEGRLQLLEVALQWSPPIEPAPRTAS